jgi:glucose-1-phosphate thymidylyltransferase
MKGIILENLPDEIDCLSMVYDTKLISLSVATLAELGIKEILIINRGNYCAEISQLINREFPDVNLKFIPNKTQDPVALIASSEEFADGEDIIVLNGSEVFIGGIKLCPPPHIYLTHSDEPHKYLVADFYGEKIRRFHSSCLSPTSFLVAAGVFVFPNTVYNVIRKLKGKTLVNLLNNYTPNVSYSILRDSFWYDINSPESLYKAISKLRLEKLEIK